MKIGVIYDFRNPRKWRRPYPELYRETLGQIVRAEELGYDNVWLAEHHFADDGYNPSPLTMAAAIAARTSRIRIGTYVLLMPFRSPVRVAEDATCIDIISNGRFDLGAGQGYAAKEFAAHCMNRSERSARLAEGVDLVRRLWTEENVTFNGKFTQVRDMTLSPKPVQQPHIPLWMGARAEKAIKRVARMGAHLMATLGPDPAPLYFETLKEHGYDPTKFHIGQVGLVHLAANENQAWEDVQEHLFNSMEYYGEILAEANDAPGDKDIWHFTSPHEMRNSNFGRAAMIGTPDQIARKMENFSQRHRFTHFVIGAQLPGLDPKKVTRSLELFATEVMPSLRR
jgi:alkanesulfonate monooxygenase SsuD/methylene tetrahydromethanopterin reductase-like flavin-dependent oxidoreductase (luciferase family)